jgi:acyl-CoA thioester hydrolase
MASPFQITIAVHPSDIDELGHVNNVVYVRWIQEVAAAHWSSAASPEIRDKYAWVVLRHEIDYKNPAFIDTEVCGSTWVGAHAGARFERYVKLESAPHKKLLVEAKTIWCLLDAKTGRPTRIPEEVLSLL